jgi:drug/metabolite transporter (DMT)-like permease
MKLQKEKITKIHVLLSICALFGFLIINFGKFNFNKISDFYFILSFVLIKSFGNFTRRVFCIKRNNTIQATWAEMLIYFIYGFLILFSGEFLFYDFFYKIFKCKIEFSMYLLTNPFVWLISLLCLSHHCFIIPAVRNAKHLIKIELLSFSNIVFSILIDFLFFGLFSLETIIGGGIITASLIVFNWKREKKEDTITLK